MLHLSSGIVRGLSSGLLGGLSVALTFGTIQFALGRDLAGFGMASASSVSSVEVSSVNRSAKSDRETVRGTQMPGRTVAVRLDSLPDTSVLVRVPAQVRQVANDQPTVASPIARPSRPSMANERKLAVACEPVVSMLTEVAKRLQPGRCLT